MKGQPTAFNHARLRRQMELRDVDVLVIRTPENSKYISEFMHIGGVVGYRPFVVFFFRDPEIKPALVVPAVDLHLAKDLSWIEDVRGYAMAEFFTDMNVSMYEDFFAAARDILDERKVSNLTVGIEKDQLTSGFQSKLEQLLEGNRIVDFSWDMDLTRMVKTDEEIRRLRRACDITIKAHESFRSAIGVGCTDYDLHRAALTRMIQEGADAISFIHISAGPEHAYAAHMPYPVGASMKEGDFAKCDMGASCRGYPADFVRSYFLGRASPRHQEIWQILNEVQLETGAWLKPGVTGGEIFDHSYRLLSKSLPDYPREFIGHGLGLSAHEQPRMNHVNRTVLEGNSLICLESSYYHEGIRHHTEEQYLVREDGTVEHWTESCPRDLVVEL